MLANKVKWKKNDELFQTRTVTFQTFDGLNYHFLIILNELIVKLIIGLVCQ